MGGAGRAKGVACGTNFHLERLVGDYLVCVLNVYVQEFRELEVLTNRDVAPLRSSTDSVSLCVRNRRK